MFIYSCVYHNMYIYIYIYIHIIAAPTSGRLGSARADPPRSVRPRAATAALRLIRVEGICAVFRFSDFGFLHIHTCTHT